LFARIAAAFEAGECRSFRLSLFCVPDDAADGSSPPQPHKPTSTPNAIPNAVDTVPILERDVRVRRDCNAEFAVPRGFGPPLERVTAALRIAGSTDIVSFAMEFRVS
jgi:hypothetical protein